jgi:hypothetical protein
MEDGGGNNAREEDGREVTAKLDEVPSRTARSLGCCSPHQAVLARDKGVVSVSHELGVQPAEDDEAAWPQKNEPQERCPGAKRVDFASDRPGSRVGPEIKHGVLYVRSSGHAFCPSHLYPSLSFWDNIVGNWV